MGKCEQCNQEIRADMTEFRDEDKTALSVLYLVSEIHKLRHDLQAVRGSQLKLEDKMR